MPYAENLGTGGAALNALYGSTPAVNSNAPLLLEPGDEGAYVYLPGSVGNYLSAPYSESFQLGNAFDVSVWVALADWTPAASCTVIGFTNWSLSVEPSGVLRFVASGVVSAGVSSTVATGAADDVARWLRVTVEVTGPAPNYTIRFYTSLDGVSWSQLGATLSGVAS
jgi:hypothetical protein